MAEVTQHAPNTPGWFDIGTDVEAAKVFYTGLFGWETADAGPPEETGGYGFFQRGGKMIAGYGPQQSPSSFWTTYVMVPSAADVTEKVRAAGGSVVVEPMQVMDQGTMAVFADAQGAFFSVWQAAQHTGAQLVRESGAFTWTELSTRDLEGSKAFYRAVFGWDAVTSGEDGPMPYTEFKVGGESVAGCMSMAAEVPAEVPAYWMPYVEVDDTDASVVKATSLGASVVVPATDFPGGRFAIVTDPQGAMLGLMHSLPSS